MVPAEVLRSESITQLATEHVGAMRALFDGYERSRRMLEGQS